MVNKLRDVLYYLRRTFPLFIFLTILLESQLICILIGRRLETILLYSTVCIVGVSFLQ